jgi:formylglycine-generating enzyme required for sulfatase activity
MSLNSLLIGSVDRGGTLLARACNFLSPARPLSCLVAVLALVTGTGSRLLAASEPTQIRWNSASGGGNTVQLTWESAVDCQYALWSSTDLDSWGLVAGYPKQGTGAAMVQDLSATERSFYRLDVSVNPPSGHVLVPAGTLSMGDSFNEAYLGELPVHSVEVDACFIQAKETTKEQWDVVRDWALSHGYDFEGLGDGVGPDHPVHSLNWYDVVKWCNARSEMAGLTPCYFTDATLATPYRSGRVDLTAASVKPDANGYRLPTEAEWEWAARGGAQGKRFPWGDTITHAQANYSSQSLYAYDVSPTRGYHPSYTSSEFPFTAPAGSFTANGYGVFDTTGNVAEWCWDWYGENYYATSPTNNPTGPATGTARVIRGGSWQSFAIDCRSSFRGGGSPAFGLITLGFRTARSQ